jgi:sugar transferase (PEP-CTERM system associated)
VIGFSIILWRLTYYVTYHLALPKRNVLIIGNGKHAKEINSLIMKSPDLNAVGFVPCDNEEQEIPDGLNKLGDFYSLEETIKKNKVDDLLIAETLCLNKGLNSILVKCKLKGTTIYDLPQFYEFILEKLPVAHLKEEWFIYSDGFTYIGNKVFRRLKRVSDFLLSMFLILLLIPLELMIVVLIKLTSKGPIFFSQERLGENYKAFKLYKFRTMIPNAEKDKPQWAERDDPRITKTGKILRKMRFDELPQLYNILKGDMSFIGPRPEREYFIKILEEKVPFYSLRLSAKPGLSGWAQVNYPYGASEEDAIEKLEYDLFYIKNMSIFLDLRIVLKTFHVIIFGLGR